MLSQEHVMFSSHLYCLLDGYDKDLQICHSCSLALYCAKVDIGNSSLVYIECSHMFALYTKSS